MAATGSAVGLGNIWGFPTQTANNGGAAFVLMYVAFVCVLAYPALMAELVIGRHTRRNMVNALPSVAAKPLVKSIGSFAGLCGVIVSSLILAFYAIVAGWMMANILSSPASALGLPAYSSWLADFSVSRNLIFCLLFSILTASVVANGVRDGIERWSTRLMPTLILLIILLTSYVLTQEGAVRGLKVYLLPDFTHIFSPQLLISAMGQAFFSLSLGVGTMLIYGSYIREDENLPLVGALVAMADTGVALLAGLLIIPAMFVALAQGVQIYDINNALIAGPGLILQVLPLLFNSLGLAGMAIAVIFFSLMVIAALTSSISMLEVPVAFASEHFQLSRSKATWITGAIIFANSACIVFYFDFLFDAVVDITTKYSQPLLAAVLCIFAGWVLHRDRLLNEIRSGYNNVEFSWFWKIWPVYIRFVCPLLIIVLFIQSILTRLTA
ncbi:MAG: sodium-dependent transporter [Gammaproteobacteria bacterium]|nr:MAG: sodium-dependent transporter [Gammaproteobacteria bacterium]